MGGKVAGTPNPAAIRFRTPPDGPSTQMWRYQAPNLVHILVYLGALYHDLGVSGPNTVCLGFYIRNRNLLRFWVDT